MRTCLRCGRVFPEVAGADVQKCPFCGHETLDAPPTDEAPLSPADPVGALTHAARVARRHYPRLLLLWLPVVVLDAAVALSVVAYQAATPGTEDLGNLTTDQALALLGVLAPLYLVDFAVTFAAWSWVARVVLGPAAPRASLAAALGVGALLTLALVAGLVLLVVPALILFHMFLFAPAALAAGRGVGGAFEESRRFSRERRTAGFTNLVVLLSVGILAAAYVLAGFLADGLSRAGISSPVVHALVEVVPGWLLWPLLPLLPASYWHLANQAPAPAAGPAPRPVRRTTKCPTCGTLVPYQPTGAPVDVTCPQCGTAGRVL